mgnify:CR=1 FL=1
MENIISSENRYYKRNLPHYSVSGACYFITFRLAGSLPEDKFEQTRKKFEIIKSRISVSNLKNSMKKVRLDNNWKRYFYKIDKLMTEYKKSPTYLKNPNIAQIVASSIKHHDSKNYNLLCYSIMPNHVHLIFTLFEERGLAKTMFSIKRFTAGQANKILKKNGQFWQHESYDHIIRNKKALNNIVHYTIHNPVKAGLVEKWQDWRWTYLKDISIL